MLLGVAHNMIVREWCQFWLLLWLAVCFSCGPFCLLQSLLVRRLDPDLVSSVDRCPPLLSASNPWRKSSTSRSQTTKHSIIRKVQSKKDGVSSRWQRCSFLPFSPPAVRLIKHSRSWIDHLIQATSWAVVIRVLNLQLLNPSLSFITCTEVKNCRFWSCKNDA